MFTSLNQNSHSMHILVSYIRWVYGLSPISSHERHMRVLKHSSGLVLRFAADEHAIHLITASGRRSGPVQIPHEPMTVTLRNNKTLYGAFLNDGRHVSTHFRFCPTSDGLVKLLMLVDLVITNAAMEEEAATLYREQSLVIY